MEIYRLIFVDILIPIITLVLGFFGGKIYQTKIIKKSNRNKMISSSGDDSIVGIDNKSVNRDKITINENGHNISGENNSTIIASGKNSQAAGRDIVNGN